MARLIQYQRVAAPVTIPAAPATVPQPGAMDPSATLRNQALRRLFARAIVVAAPALFFVPAPAPAVPVGVAVSQAQPRRALARPVAAMPSLFFVVAPAPDNVALLTVQAPAIRRAPSRVAAATSFFFVQAPATPFTDATFLAPPAPPHHRRAVTVAALPSLFFVPSLGVAVVVPVPTVAPSLRDRVIFMLRDHQMLRRMDAPMIDNAIADAYIALRSMQVAHEVFLPRAFTINQGASAFALPTSDDDRDSRIEYAGGIRLQRDRDKVFLRRRSMSEITRMREGLADGRRGPPRAFALWEESDGEVHGLCYPRADRDEPINLFCQRLPDDPRDAADAEAALFELDREQRTAVVLIAASNLAAGMRDDEMAERGLSPTMPTQWLAEAHRMIYAHEGLDSGGRMMDVVT